MFRCSTEIKRVHIGCALYLHNSCILSSLITLRCAKQDVDGTRSVDLVLLGNNYGKWSSGSAYVLQRLGQRDFSVEEDQVHHHAQIADFPPDCLGILPTVVSEAKVHGNKETHRSSMK